MSYYTQFTLTWSELERRPVKQDPLYESIVAKMGPDAPEIIQRVGLKEMSYDDWIAQWIRQNEDANYALNSDGSAKEAARWYNYEDDLKKLSSEFPNLLFELYGEGEEQTDIWKCYFFAGKIQHAKAKIIIDDFDYSKLQ